MQQKGDAMKEGKTPEKDGSTLRAYAGVSTCAISQPVYQLLTVMVKTMLGL